MGLYRRGKTYWFTITYQGRRIQKSTDTDSRRLAEKTYSKTLTDLVEGNHFESAKLKKTTFDEMAEQYLAQHEK